MRSIALSVCCVGLFSFTTLNAQEPPMDYEKKKVPPKIEDILEREVDGELSMEPDQEWRTLTPSTKRRPPQMRPFRKTT